ncbi:hypothetical protein CAC42_4811 [Sphaceloma murrayae]|uniref:RING-type E3 ubiquitin transferase n=1 Tax=Sphaceloma murrayae TaxID=2082308 RepID=A0A2K1QP13_9PEZI|nr:hypothetical protein CAC42_4811 [Sphaceloma murrayae]
MDRTGRPRDIVYCHQCENEWYRDEHGLECPSCHSDFTEVVEDGHDPREEHPPDLPPRSSRPGSIPDPDEDDISNLPWSPHGGSYIYAAPGSQRGQEQASQEQQGQGGGMFPPVLGSFASMLSGILGGRPLPTGPYPQSQNTPGSPSAHDQGQGRPMGDYATRPQSAPGSPGLGAQPGGPFGGGSTFIRSGGGPGFQWSVTTRSGGPTSTYHFSSSSGLGSRGDSGPQAFNDPHQDLRPFLTMMFGGPPGQMGGIPGMPGMAGDHFHRHGAPFGADGDPLIAMGPFGPILAGMLNPAMMRSGDGVYSQEALDRIISQLMEQNASGNAPGPATEQAISSLPKREINEKDLGTEGKAECSICMDEVKLGEQVTELPCHHWFHGDCVKAWLGEHDTCPHCRQGIMPKEDEPNRARNPNEAPRHDHMWGQGEGTQNSPFVIPESPNRPESRRRHSSNAGPSRRDSNNEGLFSRMRNAFGGGGSS